VLLDDDTPSEVQRKPERMGDSPFRRGVKELPDVCARWDSHQKRWTFHDLPTDKEGKPDPLHAAQATPEALNFLTEAARVAVRRLRKSRDPEIRSLASTLHEPLTVWLDLMRTKERGFRRTMQFSRWRGGKSVEEFLKSGKVPPDARLTENGAIKHVFQESEALWDDLVDLGFDSEPMVPAQRQPADEARLAPEPNTDQPPEELETHGTRINHCPKDFIDARKLHPKRSYEKLAAHIGIGKDTLYAITKEKRWLSDDTYRLVAEACACKPEDLYPRDIPRPDRRRP
jgi:hypothetical protein